MLTRAGWAVLCGGAAAVAVGRLFGATELFLLGATAWALVGLALVWVRRPVPVPALGRRAIPSTPSAGTLARIEIEATAGPRRTAPVTLVDEVEDTVGAHLLLGAIPAGEVRRVGYRLPTARRGPVSVGPLRVEVVDPFGLARRRWTAVGSVEVTVLPASEALDSVRPGHDGDEPVAAGGPSQRAARGAPDPATLRPYVVGDDLRRVHWPTSARIDDLVVRRDAEREQGEATVLLDTGPWLDRDAFEQAVSAAASLVHVAADSGDRLRLRTTSGYDSGSQDARRARWLLQEVLARVQTGGDAGGDAGGQATADRGSIVVLTEAGRTGFDRSVGSDPNTVVVRFGLPPNGAPATSGDVLVAPEASFAAAWRGSGPDGSPR